MNSLISSGPTTVLPLNVGVVVQWQTPMHFIGQHAVPESLKDVVNNCIMYNPDQRPTMALVVIWLESILKTL